MDYPFVDKFNKVHGGLPALLRVGATELMIGVTCQKADRGPIYYYDLILVPNPNSSAGFEIREQLLVENGDVPATAVFSRVGRIAQVKSQKQPELTKLDSMDERATLIAAWGRSFGEPWAKDVVDILSAIDVHVPFDIHPKWTTSETASGSPRASNIVQPTPALLRGAGNLANAYYSLRNRRDWPETLDYVRLGLGAHILDVTTQPDPAGGIIALLVEDDRYKTRFPATALSDGTVAFLAYVALFRLNNRMAMIAFDEPETHLHPELLLRVVGMFETLGRETTVLISTHSDRVLDGLTNPSESVVLTDLDESGSTKLIRPNAQTLERWLEGYRYRGLGDIRADGHVRSVLTRRS
ncbi:MAG TPA: AAA family ATPase [Polyangia bacterium]|nr:AAA family ATPase [Polyangia bacterium]